MPEEQILNLGELRETYREVRIGGRPYRARELTMGEAVRIQKLHETLQGKDESAAQRALDELTEIYCSIIQGMERTIVLRLDPSQLAQLQLYVSPFLHNSTDLNEAQGKVTSE